MPRMKIKAGYNNGYSYDYNILEYDKSLNEKQRATTICHELGHILLRRLGKHNAQAYYLGQLGRHEFRYKLLRIEVMATRIAKSICKPDLWDEKFAMKSLLTYFYPPRAWQYYTAKYVKLLGKERDRFRKIGVIAYESGK